MNVCTCRGCVETGSNAPPHLAPHIPISILREICIDWCKANGYEYEAERGNNQATGWSALCKASGIQMRRFFDIKRGYADHTGGAKNPCPRTYVVSFDFADRLICGLLMQEEWIGGRLAPYYGPIPVANYEKDFEQPVAEAVAA